MHIAIFCHSLLSDWNHGNAHFLRGIVTELKSRGHGVRVYEPYDAWSLQNLVHEYGAAPLLELREIYSGLESVRYDLEKLDLDEVLAPADLVIVHEWSDEELVARIGEHHARHPRYRLLFHDTHHRAITDPESMGAYDLSHYDGVLAFGQILRDLYLERGWVDRAWTWHEAADTRVFRPLHHRNGNGAGRYEGDVIWIGNWGDEERTSELQEFFLEPVAALGMEARAYGVRYPEYAQEALAAAGIEYGRWLPNYRAPEVFDRYRMTVHIPRRPYVEALPGIPTIRPFEALACGIPLISSPWRDCENLFEPGKDFLVAHNGDEMQGWMQVLRSSPVLRERLSRHGLETIRRRHTCAHRVDELMAISEELGLRTTA